MKKSLSLFLILTMAMVLSVSAPSVVCAGTATSKPKASIKQGKINPEKIYIKSADLPAFELGKMKAADMAARTKYAEGSSPQFHQLNAKTQLWMNSEKINTVNRYKTNYEIAQEALAFQKDKLKKPYQDKIDEAQEKIDEAERKAQEAEERVAELEEKCQENPGVGSTCQQELEAARAEAERLREEAEKTKEEHQPVIDENQEKINEIDAAKDVEALGKVKANQEHDVAKKREEADKKQAEASQKEKKAEAAEAAVKEAEDKLNAICPEGSGVKTTCEQKNAQAIADAQKKLEKARSDAETAKQAAEEARAEADKAKTAAEAAAEAAAAAEKKAVDDLKNENERIKGILERQDRYGVQEETAAFSEVADVDELVSQAKEEYYARNDAKIKKEKEEMIKAYQDAAIKKNPEILEALNSPFADFTAEGKKAKEILLKAEQNAIATVDANYRAAWEQEQAALRSNLQSERDKALSLRDELAKKSKSSADASGVKFGGLVSGGDTSIQNETNQLFLPSDEGVGDIILGE